MNKREIAKGSLTVESALVLPVFLFCVITMISFMDVYKLQTEHLTALCQKTMRQGAEAYRSGAAGDITLTDDYFYAPVQALIPLPPVSFHNSVTVNAWSGTDGAMQDVVRGSAAERMVYMTVTGHVIHKDPHCSYLDIKIMAVSGETVADRRNTGGERYHACEHCSRGAAPAGTVFITDGGTRYHNLATCSGLKRTVRLIPESEASGCGYCSRCGGG